MPTNASRRCPGTTFWASRVYQLRHLVIEQPVRESNPPRQIEGLVSYADRRTGHVFKCDEQELNLQILAGWLGYSQLGLPMPNRRMLSSVAQAGVEPADHQGSGTAGAPCEAWSRWSWPLCRFAYRALFQAPSTGFGPAISCVTGRRALQAAPRGQKGLRM